jgi:hypothetical protein
MITAIIVKMKRSALFCVFFLVFITCYVCADPASGGGNDIIVLVDASLSMEPCFSDLVSYLIEDLLATGVRNGDVFHLIQFSSVPVHELTLKIEDEDSLSSIVREIMFLKEKVLFGRYTDVVRALEELYLFTATLPPTHRKKIFLLTDGKHDPPDSSPYSDRDPEVVKYALSHCTRILREKNGWYALSLQIPEGVDIKKTLLHGNENNASGATRETEYQDPLTELVQILGIGDTIYRPDPRLSSLSIAGENRDSLHNTVYTHYLPFLFFIIMGVFVFVLFVLSFITITRKKKLEGTFKDMFHSEKWQETITSIFLSDIPLIEMRVSFQNPHIGFRNIHKIKDNKALSIGGGFSQFLIFLIPMPPHIAEIYKEDGKYIFNPVQKEYFPDLNGPVVDCLDREIPVVSRHGYRSKITFKEYVSPLSQLHALLHSITYETENIEGMLHTHKLALHSI